MADWATTANAAAAQATLRRDRLPQLALAVTLVGVRRVVVLVA